MTDPPGVAAGLSRQLERERRARAEAEAIAERATRDLFDRQRELELVAAVAGIANESRELESGLGEILAAVCRIGDWDFAQVFYVDPIDGDLRTGESWHAEDHDRFIPFREASELTRYEPGAGLPGRVLARGGPVVYADVVGDEHFIRRAAALSCGLHGGLAFPAVSDGRVFAVVELYSSDVLDATDELMSTTETLSAQVGRLVERHQADALLAVRTAELEATNAELTEFAYVASHDLSEPLRTISGFVQLLQRRYAGRLDADADEFIGYVVEGTERMQRLIFDLLDYSRVSQLDLVTQRVELDEIVDRVERAHGAALAESDGTIVRDGLPAVMGDATQLERLFANLVSNGLKFRAAEPPRIAIAAEPDDEEADRWLISVADNGIGMEPRHVERAFRVFQRLHAASDYPGTGIGLSICKRVVERHGGTIDVESEPGGGTRFRFSLPAAGRVSPERSAGHATETMEKSA